MNKFCKDCKWASGGFWRTGHRDCLHPDIKRDDVDYVEGVVRTFGEGCHEVRIYGKCGIDGKLWEAKR